MPPAIDELVRAARRAWPDLEVPEDELATYLAARVDERTSEARAADLLLAFACARGDEKAILAFERAYFGEVDAAAATARAPAAMAVEVKQMLRRQLFVAEADREPAIASYSGRGDLRGWVRVTATREVIRLVTRDKREVRVEDEALLDALSPNQDPEMRYIRELYRDEFAASFHAAVAALEAKDRGLLRSALIDGLGVEALGQLHGVHKATAARWLAAARQALLDGTRRELMRRLAAGQDEVDSIIRLVQSRIDVSLERVLR